jgi:glycosyltransferase involved in cell wall biosynthesis
MRTGAIHVTHAVLHLHTGGLERVVLSLVREGLRLGQRVSVLCLEEPGALAADVAAMGAPVRTIGKCPGLSPRLVGSIRAELAALGTHVLHTHQIGALFYAGPAARRAGVSAVVHTEHGRHYDARARTRWLGRWAALWADRYCCVSRDIADAVAARRVAPTRKIEVVPNGIDTTRFARCNASSLRRQLGIPEGAPVIGTVANLREVKRQDVLIRGFARLAGPVGRLPHLLLVGDGPLRQSLEQLARDSGVAPRVHFVGAQSEPERFLHMMDVFALTSRSEGMPLAILEAWAAGLPVVASRVGGLPELIRESQTGLMFESGDDAGLAAHLKTLMSDPARAAQIGAAGQSQVRERHDVSVMAGAYHRHYASLLGGSSHARPRRRTSSRSPRRPQRG